MYYQGFIFIQLVVLVSAENPYRDKINITSCENEDKRPEMTYIAPDFLIPMTEHRTYQRKGNILEKKVEESQLKMITNDDCKFKRPFRDALGFPLIVWVMVYINHV